MAQIVKNVYSANRASKPIQQNDQQFNKLLALIDQLNIQTSNDMPLEDLIANNAYALADGIRAGFTLNKPDGKIGGISKNTIINTPTIINEDTMFDNVTFTSGDFKGAMIHIKKTSASAPATIAIFNNCTFKKRKEDSPSTHIFVDNAIATFIGCKWIGEFDASGTNVIIDAPVVPPTNLNFIGCYNKTGAAVIGPAPSFCVTGTSIGSYFI